uniref:Uncharacterized protein n=1 Tax=Tanacetum cinerariifolium TaxID=118510 RepID=A0A6L2M2Q7_TANCI|nr:hypothetical protein [Tanacetum cinerariifolium]
MTIKVPQPSGSTNDVADENVTHNSNDPPLSENTKTSQAAEIAKLKERVKKLEKKRGSKLTKSKETEEPVVNAATTISLIPVSTVDPVTTAGELVVTTVCVEISNELTIAQTLIEIKSAKPKAVTTAATTVTPVSTRPRAKGIVFHDQEEQASTSTPIVSSQQPSQVTVKDKGKAKMIEPEKPLKKKDQIMLDQELTAKLQAEEEKEERIAREKAQKVQEANIAWDDIQAKVETDYELALRIQSEEQEKLSID